MRDLGLLNGYPVISFDYSYYLWAETNGQGRLEQITNSQQDLRYSYDPNGNVLSIQDYMAGSLQTQTFTYDELDRLTSGVANGGTGGTYALQNYTYNGTTGNLSSKEGVNYTYGDSLHKHAVTLMGTDTFTYDANGNQITRSVGGNSYTLSYDAENRLVGVNGAASATFVYDGDGNRVKGTIGGVTTSYIGNYFEWTGSTSSMKKYYYAGSTRVAMRTGSNTLEYLLGDHLGSQSITTDNNGLNPKEIRYYPWGTERYTSGTTPTTFHFTGQRLESYINLYWYGSRWYDPYLSRWIQPDSIVPSNKTYSPLVVDYHETKFLMQLNQENWRRLQDLNFKLPAVPINSTTFDRYAYALNNPVIYTDPDGHNPLLIIIAIIGAFIFFSQVPSDVYQPNPADQGDPAVMAFGTTLMAAPALGPYLCADGDCTNETNPVIDFLSNQLNRVSHIMDTKHAWGRLITLSGNIAEDYKAIQPYIQQAINNGPVKQIGTTPAGIAIYEYVTKINGQEVIVNAFITANGVIQIVDAWVTK